MYFALRSIHRWYCVRFFSLIRSIRLSFVIHTASIHNRDGRIYFHSECFAVFSFSFFFLVNCFCRFLLYYWIRFDREICARADRRRRWRRKEMKSERETHRMPNEPCTKIKENIFFFAQRKHANDLTRFACVCVRVFGVSIAKFGSISTLTMYVFWALDEFREANQNR